MKKTICVILATIFAVLLFGKSPALASSKLIENNSKAKLVEETCSNYIEMSKDEKLKHIEKIDNMLSSLLANNVEIEEIEKVMNNYNVFLLKSEKVISSKNAISPKSVGSDVSLVAPTIWYDSNINQWIVSGGGSWSYDDWKDDLDYLHWLYQGEYIDMGGTDAVGISFYNTIYN